MRPAQSVVEVMQDTLDAHEDLHGFLRLGVDILLVRLRGRSSTASLDNTVLNWTLISYISSFGLMFGSKRLRVLSELFLTILFH